MNFGRAVKTAARASAEYLASFVIGLRQRRLEPPINTDPIRVNLGSAWHTAPGWINLDRTINVAIDRLPGAANMLRLVGLLPSEQFERIKAGLWRSVTFWDAKYPLPLADNVADYVYTSHFVEHLDIGTAQQVLRESYRVLKPGGIIRVVVPDLFRIAGEYVDIMRAVLGGELSLENRVVYLSAERLAGDVPNSFAGQLFEPTVERQSLFGHRWMYDHWSLQLALKSVGFVGIVERQFRRGEVPDLELLDIRPTNSLHMEATKPAER